MKRIRKSVMHPGNARLRYHEIFGHGQKTGAGIRWWVTWEQVAQLGKHRSPPLPSPVWLLTSAATFGQRVTGSRSTTRMW